MRMLSYEASWLYTTLSRIGFENIQVRIFPLNVIQGWNVSCVLASKPGQNHGKANLGQ